MNYSRKFYSLKTGTIGCQNYKIKKMKRAWKNLATQKDHYKASSIDYR